MKKILITLFSLFLITACSDTSDLENRLTDVEKRLDQLEDLDLDELILDLEEIRGKIDTLDMAIDSIQDVLKEIKDELENPEEGAIYWGDVRTDNEFAEIAAGGYTKITGRVFAQNSNHIAQLSKVTFIGSNLIVSGLSGDLSFDNIEVVSGSISIVKTEDITNLSFPLLRSVGFDFSIDPDACSQLASLSLPQLEVVSGSMSLYFSNVYLSTNILSSLDVSKLSMVGGDFNISNSDVLNTVNLPMTYIGGNFIIDFNDELSLGASHFDDVKYIGGSISINDNYSIYNGSIPNSSKVAGVIFNNLEHLGEGFSFSGSEDYISVSGFNKLESMNGDLSILVSISELGTDDITIFESLTDIGGSLDIVSAITSEVDPSAVTILSGFENLISVGGDFKLHLDRIESKDAFQNLVVTGLGNDSHNSFVIDADEIPSFRSFIGVSKLYADISLLISATKIDNLFPSFTQSFDNSEFIIPANLDIFFSNNESIQTLNGGFGTITSLHSLRIGSDFAISDFIIDDAFNQLTKVGEYSYFDETSFVDLLVKESTDLSSFQAYFIEKARDYKESIANYNDDLFLYDLDYIQFQKDSVLYYDEYQYDTDSLYVIPQAPIVPVYEELYTANIDIHKGDKDLENSDLYYNYAANKIDPNSDIPALIQCFMHFGDLEADELGY